MRADGTETGADHLGTVAAWARPQHCHLAPQPGRTGRRVLLRARQDDRRGAWLFRAAPLAPRHAATAQAVDAGKDHGLGPDTRGRLPSYPGVTAPSCLRAIAGMRKLVSGRGDGYRYAQLILRNACAGMTVRVYGRTAGVSSGIPRARHIRKSSRSTYSGAPNV